MPMFAASSPLKVWRPVTPTLTLSSSVNRLRVNTRLSSTSQSPASSKPWKLSLVKNPSVLPRYDKLTKRNLTVFSLPLTWPFAKDARRSPAFTRPTSWRRPTVCSCALSARSPSSTQWSRLMISSLITPVCKWCQTHISSMSWWVKHVLQF